MSDRWVVDADYPKGHLVPMTPAEQAQRDADEAIGVAASRASEAARANLVAITAAITGRMASLRTARTALAAGSIFGSFNSNEKKVLDALLQDDLQLARLVLELFDASDA